MTAPSIRSTTGYVNLGHTFAHLLMLIFPTAVLAMEGAWGMGYAELLPLGFAGYLLFGIGSLPAGWLADRWSSAWMMTLFFLGSGFACIATGLAVGPWSLALGLTLVGLFASIYHPVAMQASPLPRKNSVISQALPQRSASQPAGSEPSPNNRYPAKPSGSSSA